MRHIETEIIHGGSGKDKTYGSVVTPIYQTAVFVGGNGPKYTRFDNPTRDALEEAICGLEGGARAIATSSGASAIHLVLMMLKAGDHVVCGKEVHGGTVMLIGEIMGKFGVDSTFVDLTDANAVRETIRENTKLLWVEAPTNPFMKYVDLKVIGDIAHGVGALMVVDNTLMTGVLQRPMGDGADIVVYSSTKYLNGHSDVVGGAVVARKKEVGDELKRLAGFLGVGESPMEAWLVLRGMKTLVQRLRVHEYNAKALWDFFEGQRGIEQVYYPGYGGVVCVQMNLDFFDLEAFIDSLEYIKFSYSSGGISSNVSNLWEQGKRYLSEDRLKDTGVKPGLLRFSPGLEHHEDLINDLEKALCTSLKEPCDEDICLRGSF